MGTTSNRLRRRIGCVVKFFAEFVDGIEIIPVRVGGALLPPEDALPLCLTPLLNYQAIELRHDHWESDVTDLLTAVKKLLTSNQSLQAEHKDRLDAKQL